MSLSIQRLDDFVEAHEITDERQMLAIACLSRVGKCAGHDVAKLGVCPLKCSFEGFRAVQIGFDDFLGERRDACLDCGSERVP